MCGARWGPSPPGSCLRRLLRPPSHRFFPSSRWFRSPRISWARGQRHGRPSQQSRQACSPVRCSTAGGCAGCLSPLTAVAGPAAGWLVFVAVLAVLAGATGAAAWGTHRLLTGRHPLPAALALPITWTALEWGLAHLPFGLAFPWAPLGLGLARWPELLGPAELVGVGGVTAWLACVNGLLASAVNRVPVAARARGAGMMVAAGAAALLVGVMPVDVGVRACLGPGR